MCHLNSRLVLNAKYMYIPITRSDTQKAENLHVCTYINHTLMLIQLKDVPS